MLRPASYARSRCGSARRHRATTSGVSIGAIVPARSADLALGPRFGDHTGGFLQAWPVVRFPAIRATPLLFLATPLPQTPYELPRPTTGTGAGTDGHRLGRLAFGTVMAGYVAYACLFI